MTSDIISIIMIVLVGLVIVSIPVVYYAFKLQGFVKYSKMWKPWKKLAFGWALTTIGGGCRSDNHFYYFLFHGLN